MLGFSPLSQGPVGTSGGVSGNITVSVSGVAATGLELIPPRQVMTRLRYSF